MKKLLKLLSSRMIIVGMLILLQLSNIRSRNLEA